MTITRSFVVAVFFALSMSVVSQASAELITAFDFVGNGAGDTRVRGWEFQVLSDIDVIALGIWDQSSNGLDTSHDVGLWTASGTLVASVTVSSGTTSPLETPGGSPNGGFRYANLGTAVTLSAGTNYVLGAHFINQTQDVFVNNTTSEVFDSRISFVTSRFINNENGLAFPNSTSTADFLTADLIVTTVPEPSSLAMFTLVAIGSVAIRFRRRKEKREKQLQQVRAHNQ